MAEKRSLTKELTKGFIAENGSEEKQVGQDIMWYIWCNQNSPVFGKDKMTTFERYFIDDKATHKEVLDNFVALADELEFKILGLTFSPVKGPEGNIEFLGHLTLADVPGIRPDTADVVRQAHETLKG